ncbi:MAG: hypothetical protein WC505_06305 [Patescibacteria group bacterium]
MTNDETPICAAEPITVEQHQQEVRQQRAVLRLADDLGLVAPLAEVGITAENSNLVSALADSFERSKAYQASSDRKAEALRLAGKEPYPCRNAVCPRQCPNRDGRYHFCTTNDSHDCLYQMDDGPPNSLNYEEYMPSHQEALDRLEKHGLLRGDRQRYIEESARFGKATNQQERSSVEVKGITMQQLQLCCSVAMQEFAQNPYVRRDTGEEFCDQLLEETELLAQNIGLNVEKAMGIYPNISRL